MPSLRLASCLMTATSFVLTASNLQMVTRLGCAGLSGLGWAGLAGLGWRWRWQGFYLECFHCAAQWADTQIVSQQTPRLHHLHHLHTPPGLKIETLPLVYQVPRDEDSYFLQDWN